MSFESRTVPLPEPAPRQLSHTRTVVYQGYDRDDGLWDIEATLTDVKAYTYRMPNEAPMPAGQRIHGLSIRLTVDDALRIHDVATAMDDIPHATCTDAPFNMHKLKGCQMGRGWRKQVQALLGGTEGCTHLREMLFNMATAAFQTVPSGQWHRRDRAGLPDESWTDKPYFLDQCHTWASHSPTTARIFPMYYQPKAASGKEG